MGTTQYGSTAERSAGGTGTMERTALGTAHLRIKSVPPTGSGGMVQAEVQYAPNTPATEQFLAPGVLVNLPLNPNWTGTIAKGAIYEITAFGG